MSAPRADEIDKIACVIDGRDMEPPEPFERVMAALAVLKPGERVRLLLPREPFPLYRVLESAGYAWETERIESIESREGGVVFAILIGRRKA